MTGNGWLSAKKSEAEIARGKQAAEALRRQRRGQRASSSSSSLPVSKKRNKRGAVPNKRGKQSKGSNKKLAPSPASSSSTVDQEDDDDSLQDFLVDDEEELEEEEEQDWSEQDEDEEEDDEVLPEEDDSDEASIINDKTSKKGAKKKIDISDESSSDNDGDDTRGRFSSKSFPSTNGKRKQTSAVLRSTKRKTATSEQSKVKSQRQQQNMGMKKTTTTKIATKQSLVDLFSSDSEIDITKQPSNKKRPIESNQDEEFRRKNLKPAAKKVATARNQANQHKFISFSSDDDDDDDDELLVNPFAKQPSGPIKARAETKSSFFTAKSAASSAQMIKKEQPPTNRTEEEPTPVLVRRTNKTLRRFDDDDEDDDEKQSGGAAQQSTLFGNSHRDENVASEEKAKVHGVAPTVTIDDIVDSDEEMAMALALSESEALAKQHEQTSKKKNRFAKFAASSSSRKSVLADSDDDEKSVEAEDEDDDYGEEDLDEDAKEARSILQTAQRLSAHVLHHLKSWSGSDTDATKGMIVQDGAIALTIGDAQSNEQLSSSWISNETLRKVCPTVDLAPYQQIGVNWLALLHGLTVDVDGKPTNVNGVLADEMGLGKTCQTIAFLSWLKYHQHGDTGLPKSGDSNNPLSLDSEDDDDAAVNAKENASSPVQPHLVVVPASVLQNWKIEFEKFAPHLNVVKYHGSLAEREEIKEHLSQYLSGRQIRPQDSLDVILVPMAYFSKEKSDDRSFLRKFRFDYLVCDEAHQLKNYRGQRYKTLDKFRTKHRLLLSGTPVMNNPQELMSLLCFLMPLFSRKSQGFAADEDKNDGGSRMLQHFVSLDKGKDDAAAYRKLKELFAPFVLRRRKKDVLSQILPPKERRVEFVELDQTGRSIYNGILENHVKNKGKSSREHVFTQLRKAAHHPLLLRTRYLEADQKQHLVDSFYKYGAFRGEGCTKAKVYAELEKFNDFDIHLTALELLEANRMREADLRRYILDEEDLFSSAKFVRLRSLLPDLVSKGHRILIFSVWTTCLDLLSCLLEQLNMKYLRMEGSTPVSERQSLIDEFNHDTSVPIFLLSTKACGLGINLTAADCAIMHDLDFNPFNDLQAEDRCHRIGQKKPVTVYKLVSKDTVDEDIYSMQERKAKMSAAIMEASSKFEEKKERENVLQTAVDRYLGSPRGLKRK